MPWVIAGICTSETKEQSVEHCNRLAMFGSLFRRSEWGGVLIRWHLSVALIGGLHVDPVSAKPSCPVGYFRNSSSVPVSCSPCSSCPINHIVRKLCSRLNDTVCGPFYEFEFNQRQPRNGTQNLLGDRSSYFNKLAYRLAYDGYARGLDNIALSTTASSPDEAVTVRCGQPQWRMLCYGLVAAIVVLVSVALTAFTLFTYCRSSVKTIRLDETPGVSRDPEVNEDEHPSMSSAIIVSRDVRHIEEQLIHNQRRKAFLRWLFGSSAAADRLFSSNDYLDERHRRRFLLMLNRSTPGDSPTDALPLEPYPGMTLTARTDHRHAVQVDSSDEAVVESGLVGSQLDLQTTCSSEDGVQSEEQNMISAGDRSLLLPQNSGLQTGDQLD